MSNSNHVNLTAFATTATSAIATGAATAGAVAAVVIVASNVAGVACGVLAVGFAAVTAAAIAAWVKTDGSTTAGQYLRYVRDHSPFMLIKYALVPFSTKQEPSIFPNTATDIGRFWLNEFSLLLDNIENNKKDVFLYRFSRNTYSSTVNDYLSGRSRDIDDWGELILWRLIKMKPLLGKAEVNALSHAIISNDFDVVRDVLNRLPKNNRVILARLFQLIKIDTYQSREKLMSRVSYARVYGPITLDIGEELLDQEIGVQMNLNQVAKRWVSVLFGDNLSDPELLNDEDLLCNSDLYSHGRFNFKLNPDHSLCLRKGELQRRIFGLMYRYFSDNV